MSGYRDLRRRWLAALRRSGTDCAYLLAASGMVSVPPANLEGPAAPGAAHASAELASAPLTASERRAWRQLVRELSAKPK